MLNKAELFQAGGGSEDVASKGWAIPGKSPSSRALEAAALHRAMRSDSDKSLE